MKTIAKFLLGLIVLIEIIITGFIFIKIPILILFLPFIMITYWIGSKIFKKYETNPEDDDDVFTSLKDFKYTDENALTSQVKSETKKFFKYSICRKIFNTIKRGARL